MKAIFIPHSLYMEFLARKESLLKFLKLSSLASTLSSPDVAFYIRCNQRLKDCLPEPIVESFESINFEPDLKHLIEGGLDNAIQSRLEKIKTLDLEKELSDEKSKMLTCDILEGDVILFTYIDKPEDSSQDVGEQELYDRLLTQMCAFYPFHQVAKLPIFKAYVQAAQAAITAN